MSRIFFLSVSFYIILQDDLRMKRNETEMKTFIQNTIAATGSGASQANKRPQSPPAFAIQQTGDGVRHRLRSL